MLTFHSISFEKSNKTIYSIACWIAPCIGHCFHCCLFLCRQSERARKNAEGALSEASTRINELTIQITTITGDRRRFESELSSLRAEADEATRARREAEDRADRLQLEVNRLIEELRREQDNYKNAEGVRKQLEIEIREISVRLEEAESFAQREGKRLVAKLQSRVSHRPRYFELIVDISDSYWSTGMDISSLYF